MNEPTCSNSYIEVLIRFLREDLIKYYDELSREMEYREFRAQWHIRRSLLNSARAQFLAQEQARLETLKNQMTQASSAQTPAKIADVSSVQPGKEQEERVSTPASAPSPSIVSLIASGVKTDALLRAEQKMSTSVLSDSNVSLPEQRILNLSESVQDKKLSMEAASSSEAAAAESRARKTWNSPDESVAEIGKLTETGSGRKTWEAPPDGEVNIASPLPKCHPSDSSIQFAMYRDKQKSSDKEKTPGSSVRADAFKTSTHHAGDSSLQNILYPSTLSEKSGLDAQPLNTVTWPSDLDAGGLVMSHPSDSSAQDVLYGSTTKAVSEARTPSSLTQGHPSDSSAQQLLYTGSAQEGANTDARSLEHGHPSDSSVSGLLYPTAVDTPTSNTAHLSQHGHPSNSQVSLSHGSGSDGLNLVQAMQHSSRSTWKHPSDASVQKLFGNLTEESQRTTRGTPPSSVAQDILYPSLDEQSTSYVSHHRGTPPQSVAQNILYQRGEESGQLHGVMPTRGTPPSSVIQDIMYPSGEGTVGEKTRVSTRGHEPAVTITNVMYYVRDEGETEMMIC